MLSSHVSTQVQRRCEPLVALITGEIGLAVTERVLPKGSWIFEGFTTSFANTLLQIRVGDGVSAEVTFGQEGGGTDQADKFLLAAQNWMLELLV